MTQPGRSVVLAAAAVLALGLSATACGGSGGGSDRPDGRVQVVAAFAPLAEAAERVGGDVVELENLTPAGVEPHDLELSPSQVEALADADLVVYLGGGFQPGVARVADRRDEGTLDVLSALDRGEGDEADPHVWLDPTLQAEVASAIADALSEAAPEHEAAFRENAQAYAEELEALDGELRAGLANCERRDIVTAHEAFGALAARYELTQVAVSGLSPSAEAEAGRIAELADVIRDRDVTTVFAEELVSPKLAEALAREAGVQVDVLDPIENLRPGDDYADAMRRNLNALRKALGCT